MSNPKPEKQAKRPSLAGPAQARSENYGYYADVLLCCVPLCALSCYYYGPRPALLMAAALVTAYLCDCLLAPLHGSAARVREPSSACFAALIVLMMPASIPYFIVVVATVAAVLVKEAFGGVGHYPFHPAAVGMAVAGISWPSSVFSYPSPGTVLPLWGSMDGVALSSGMNATLRAGGLPSASTMNLLIGNVAGPLGASAALVIAACGLFLLCRGRIRLSTLVPYLAFGLGLAWVLPQLNELPAFSLPWTYVSQRVYFEKYMLLSGTMLFGGMFLICEPVTMPNRTNARVVYGAVLGIATYVFRVASPYETGVCFALLIAGAIPEWLDLISHRFERIRFMRKEEQRLAKANKPE